MGSEEWTSEVERSGLESVLEGPAESGVESRAGLATESGVEWT